MEPNVTAAALVTIWLFLCAMGCAVTTWLVLRVWRRRKQTALPTKLVISAVALSAMIGALGTLAGLLKALRAVDGESVDPSQKARMLAEGISEAMNCSAFALAVWIPIAILVLVKTKAGKRASH
jgi:biopolymer transport protein ExbB/TolQ